MNMKANKIIFSSKKEVVILTKKSVLKFLGKYKSLNINLSFIILFSLTSCHNNDEIFLKELKQQNSFLEKNLLQTKELMRAKSFGNPYIVPYMNLFLIQDTLTKKYLNSLMISSKEMIKDSFLLYGKKYNLFIDSVSNERNTKFFPSDIPLLKIKTDSLVEIENSDIKKEIIKQKILQQQIVLANSCIDASNTCGLGIRYLNSFGYRLIIEKTDSLLFLNLKCYDPRKLPYFEKLEFLSIQKINKGEYEDLTEFININSLVLNQKNEDDALKITLKQLSKGFYRINCNKLSISDIGKLIKDSTFFDFSIN